MESQQTQMYTKSRTIQRMKDSLCFSRTHTNTMAQRNPHEFDWKIVFLVR